MLLNPYILKEGQPVRRLFLQVPHLVENEAWTPTKDKNTRVLTLDILPKKNDLYILLGSPDWEPRGLVNYIEVICSNLRMLMRVYGIAKEKMQIHWFEIAHTREKVFFNSFTFDHDDGIWLSEPQHQDISIDEVPFNVEEYRILLS